MSEEAKSDRVLKIVDNYYTSRVREFGASPKGVDWNGEDSQFLRFQQLMRIADYEQGSFSLLDFGCGYGALLDYLKTSFPLVKYTGYDVSEEMVKAGRIKYGEPATFLTELPEDFRTDYTVASGIFNVCPGIDKQTWQEYIFQTLQQINNVSLKGFSFNVLTSYSDKEFMKDHLHYAVPEEMFGYCKLNFSRHVALLHDYPLYEFSILVRK